MSAMTETDSAISGGSVRDVLADTNNLSERWKTASGPVRYGQEPTTADWGWADGAGWGREETQRLERRPYSLPRLSPLRSSRSARERYAQSAWPESHPVSVQKRSDTDRGGHPRPRQALLQEIRHPVAPPDPAGFPEGSCGVRRKTGAPAGRRQENAAHLDRAGHPARVSVRAGRAPHAPARGAR